MNLKPQDILVLLKLVALGKIPWSFNKIAIDLGMSASEVHAATRRALGARLADKDNGLIRPNIPNLEEFLLHGLQYTFVAERGELNVGMPTAYAVEPLAQHFVGIKEPPPIWPDANGDVRGESFTPIYKSAPQAAKNDRKLYVLLSLVDALRGGHTRERDMAKKELAQRLSEYDKATDNNFLPNKDQLIIGGEIVVSQAALKKIAQRYHLLRLVLFGSAAREQLTPKSDIDVLIEFETGHSMSLGGMARLNNELSALFGGRKVDIATPAIMNNPYRARAIKKDMKVLYAA